MNWSLVLRPWQKAESLIHLIIHCQDVTAMSSACRALTAISLNTQVNALRRMNYRWPRPSCPSLLWISNALLGGYIMCVNLTVWVCDCVCVWAPEEAVRQIETAEKIMSRVVIAFLPLNGPRGRKRGGGGGFLWHHQNIHMWPVRLILICYWNWTHQSIPTLTNQPNNGYLLKLNVTWWP